MFSFGSFDFSFGKDSDKPVPPPAFAEQGNGGEEDGTRASRENYGKNFMTVPGPDNSLKSEEVLTPEELKAKIEELEKEESWQKDIVAGDPVNEVAAARIVEIGTLLTNLREKLANQVGSSYGS